MAGNLKQMNRCRICGCTDNDACHAPCGEPCHWVEPDLCSSCADDTEELLVQPFTEGEAAQYIRARGVGAGGLR